jgi:nucleotide-binding universal stress UspA family protein
MIQVKTVVCYVDFSALPGDVLAAGVELARSFGARVLAAAMIPLPGVRAAGYLLPDSGGELSDVDYARTALQLEELVNSTPHHGLKVEPYPISAESDAGLLSLLERESADVLLVGNTGSRPLLMRLNHLREKIYRYAPCPVLSINSAAVSAGLRMPSLGARTPRFVAASTLEPPSEAAVLAAILMARHYQAELTILLVSPHRHEAECRPPHFWDFLAGFSSESQELLSSLVCPEWLSPQPQVMARAGAPDRGIVATAADLAADLLIIGARRPPLGLPLWPSFASRLASAAPCPLLVVGQHGLKNLLLNLQPQTVVVRRRGAAAGQA